LRKRIAVAGAVTLALALIMSASASGGTVQVRAVHVRDSTQKYKVRPHSLKFSFGAIFPPVKINKIHRWHHWNHAETKAHGVLHYNPCKPNCAAGNERHRRAKVKLSHVRRCNGRRVYRRIAITPRGMPTHTHTITCSGQLR